MKIERRQYTVFMAHNRLAVFYNRCLDQETKKPYFLLRVTKGLSDIQGSETKSWITLGEMKIEQSELRDFLEKLTELAK